MKKKKVALVYDWMDKWGGVERLLIILHEMYPKAPVYTSFYSREALAWTRGIKVKTSFMQYLPSFVKTNRVLSLLFFPLAFRSFDFSKYDTVISVSSAFAKGIRTHSTSSGSATKHIAIILTPPRFLWSHRKEYVPGSIKHLIEPLLSILKKWDFRTAQKPDVLFAISKRVRHRVKKYYGRDAEVLYPPFDIKYWKKIKTSKTTGSYLVVSRLEKYKKIDLVVRTFNKLGLPLVVIGQGTQEKKLRKMANDNIIFISNLTDTELARYYKSARALIMPQDEDFGYTSLEAQFFGCPVISYKNSGAIETIQENKTGVFFEKQTVQSLMNAIERSKKIPYNEPHESNHLRGRSWDKTLATFKKKISKAV